GVWAAAKATDLVAAPLLVALANRREGGNASVGLGASLSVLFLAIVAAASVAAWRDQRERELEEESSRLFFTTLRDLNARRTSFGPDSPPPSFPDIPLGRMESAFLDYQIAALARAAEMVRLYRDERAAWDARGDAAPAWLAARLAGAQRLHAEAEAWD